MDEFQRVSRTLLGRTGLDAQLAATYRALIERAFGANLLGELLAASAQAGGGKHGLARLEQIFAADSSQRLQFLAKQVVKLWLFSQYNDPEQGGRLTIAGNYSRALFWASVGAFPPSLSRGAHGYWSDKPDLE
jgi:hypothetical protein